MDIVDMAVAFGTDDLPVSELRRLATLADELGFGSLWLTESRGRDVFSVLSVIASSTGSIELGTGIVNAWSRTGTALVQSAATVVEISGGRRFNLGLATSGRALIEKFHGIPFDRPVSRLRTVAGQLRAALDKPGQVAVEAPDPEAVLRLRFAPGDIRLFLAGAGVASRQVVAETADGWLPIWPSRRACAAHVTSLRLAAAGAGRTELVVAAYLYTSVDGTDMAVDAVRKTLAWYLAANGTVYARMFRDCGYEMEVDAVQSLWQAGNRAGAAAALSDELLADTSLTGSAEQVVARARAFRAVGIDIPVLRFAASADPDAIGDRLHSIAAEVRLQG